MRFPFALLLAAILMTKDFSSSAIARAVPHWPYDKLVADSDLVAIVEPTENQAAADELPTSLTGRPATDFQAINTRFRVLTTLKASGDAPTELTVLHFHYSQRVTTIVNGAAFVRFLIGPLQYEKHSLRDGKLLKG